MNDAELIYKGMYFIASARSKGSLERYGDLFPGVKTQVRYYGVVIVRTDGGQVVSWKKISGVSLWSLVKAAAPVASRMEAETTLVGI